MLTRVDRPIMAVPDREVAAKNWIRLLGAEHSHDNRIDGLGALRSSFRLGTGWVEFLEPDGPGPIADAVARRGAHLYATGATTDDVGALAGHLEHCQVEVLREHGQAWVGFGVNHAHGFVVALSPDEPQAPIGLIDEFYEATNLVHDHREAVALYTHIFGLDAEAFCPIDSEHYGYDGTLTLFHPDTLHRFEIITPADERQTMGRFFAKTGPSLYMMFAETGRLEEITSLARELDLPHTLEKGSAFLHPAALGGMMLGLSRRSLGWLWSGHPERVEPA